MFGVQGDEDLLEAEAKGYIVAQIIYDCFQVSMPMPTSPAKDSAQCRTLAKTPPLPLATFLRESDSMRSPAENAQND